MSCSQSFNRPCSPLKRTQAELKLFPAVFSSTGSFYVPSTAPSVVTGLVFTEITIPAGLNTDTTLTLDISQLNVRNNVVIATASQPTTGAYYNAASVYPTHVVFTGIATPGALTNILIGYY